MVRDTFEAYNQFRTLWTPKFNELKGHILALQRALNNPSSAPEEKLTAFNRLNTAISDLTPLEQIQQEAAVAFEALVRAGSCRYAGRARYHLGLQPKQRFGASTIWCRASIPMFRSR